MSFIQIGGDGSYLPAPATLTEALIAPAERADILIDFSATPAKPVHTGMRTMQMQKLTPR